MEYADIVIKSNAVFTVCSSNPLKGAVAVKGNKILGVFSHSEIDKYINSTTTVYEYEDNLVMPGLIDGHEHLWWGAVADSKYMVDLTSSTSEDECLEMIAKYAEANSEDIRVRGFGWFPANWNDVPLPTKEPLDKIIPDRPAYFMCADAHTCWMNSLALTESGYTPDMKLEGGSVGVDVNGEMNGLIFEPDALVYAWAKMYDFPEVQIKEIICNFMRGLASKGVTSLSEMSGDGYDEMFYNRYKVFREMSEKGKFTSRVHLYTRLMGLTDFSTAKEWQKEFYSDKFRLNGLKGFLDGVTSTYTGLLLAPYADRPDTCGEGVPLASKESLEASVIAGNAVGLPVRIHALGDGAVRMALDAYESSNKVNGKQRIPNAVEHIETIDPSDIPRFKELGVIASMQGEHMPMEMNEKVVRLGKERCRYEWPFRSLIDAGATLAFGTDFPVVRYNQFPGIYAAIARKNYDGSVAGVDNGEKLTLPEALRANTLGSATVYGREKELGSLEAGKLADIVVLDRNLFDVPVEEINDTNVILTVMDGNVTYEA